MKRLIVPSPLWEREGIAVARIVTGIFLIFHGQAIFFEEKMKEYGAWDIFKDNSAGVFLPYLGKGCEFVAGILLTLGLFTRIACITIACTFIYISFFVGNGKVWYEDQHPFMFVLVSFIFFFLGPGRWSMDDILFRKMKKSTSGKKEKRLPTKSEKPL